MWLGGLCEIQQIFSSLCDVSKFLELISGVENSLIGLSASREKSRTYSFRSRLRRHMVTDDPIYSLFVSTSSTGYPWAFYCTICHRDVYMSTRGAGELDCHFGILKHWTADVIYRVNNGLPVNNRLRDPITLSAEQEAPCLSRICRCRAEGFIFPEDLLPQCTCEDSNVPLMTMVNCLVELLCCGGSYVLLR